MGTGPPMGAAQPRNDSESSDDDGSRSLRSSSSSGSASGHETRTKKRGRASSGAARLAESKELSARSLGSSAPSSRNSERLPPRSSAAGGPWCCCSMQQGRKEVLVGNMRPAAQKGQRRRDGDRERDRERDRRCGRDGKEEEKLREKRSSAGVVGEKIEKTGGIQLGNAIVSEAFKGTVDQAWVAADFGFPQISRPADDDDDARSVRSDFSVRTAVVAQHSQQPQDAAGVKAALKDFVQNLVKGRELHLQPRGGGPLRALPCRLERDLSALVVGGPPSPQPLAFAQVAHIYRGLEAVMLNLEFNIDTNMVFFELAEGNCITFHLGHARLADDFVLFMRLICTMQRQRQKQAGPARQQSQNLDDDDDAHSVCSVQTGICQQALNSTPVATMKNDPKEVKNMFKMFTETMRRGRDFYVLRHDGTLHDVECKLTKGHDEFVMIKEGQHRAIALKDILNLRTCQEARKLKLGFTVDERCTTVELKSGECITFKFGHVEACERFILCMRILVEKKRPVFASHGLESQQAPLSARSSVSTARQDPKSAVEAFVRTMLAGCQLSVVGPTGLAQVRCSMDPDLKGLKFTAPDGSAREVPLRDIKAIHAGAEARALGLSGIAVDERCATVELVTGDCITFKFPDATQLERFAGCMRVFVSAHRR